MRPEQFEGQKGEGAAGARARAVPRRAGQCLKRLVPAHALGACHAAAAAPRLAGRRYESERLGSAAKRAGRKQAKQVFEGLPLRGQRVATGADLGPAAPFGGGGGANRF